METKVKTTETKEYIYNEEESQQILKRVIKDVGEIGFYWDYNNSLSEKDILRIIKEDEGLCEVENEIYYSNYDYISEEINELVENRLTNEEKTDEDLKEFVFDGLRDEYNFNIEDLLKNSNANIRLTLMTNEDFLNIPYYKTTDYFKDFRKIFKRVITLKDFETEISENIGSDYAHLVFYANIKGNDILKLREQFQKGKVTLRKGLSCGLFNDCQGCGSQLDIKTKKEITIDIKNWTGDDSKNTGYDNLKICLDNDRYGINEVYGLTCECWGSFY